MAAISAKGKVQVQATLSAVKEMSGWTFYGCMISMLFVLVYPYLSPVILFIKVRTIFAILILRKVPDVTYGK